MHRRYTQTASLRIERADGESTPPKIVGHAVVYNQKTTLIDMASWQWNEIIRPGAAARAIRENQDVRSLFNHDANFVLGRTSSGTLLMREDTTGLMTETLAPTTQIVRDLVLSPIERGDITGMSFAFEPVMSNSRTVTKNADGSKTIELGGLRITEQYQGDKLIETWEVLDMNMYDISPVTYPAYSGTDVGMRAMYSRDMQDYIEKRSRHDRVDLYPLPTPRLDKMRKRTGGGE
jgi:HK97 family phage prohead protease